MSRASLIEQLYVKRKSALEFNYDALWAPPIMSIFSQQDISELYKIATSLKYNGNIEKKYELIDAIMKSRGFYRAHCGTNRVVYNFFENTTFVAKVALDKIGLADSPAEYKNQNFFKPFCCKIFEVDPTGVIAFVERVNPISSIEEFLSVADDVFNMMVTKIIGKYVVDDLGSEKYMNYGLRYNSNGYTFGPVIIDYPYAYELDGGKLICQKPIKTITGMMVPCGGEIDYDVGFNHLICTRCGRKYTAMDLKKNDKNIIVMFGDDVKGDSKMRARIINGDGKVIMDSGRSSSTYITKEEYEYKPLKLEPGEKLISTVRRIRNKPINERRSEMYSQLQAEMYNRMNNTGPFNPVIKQKTITSTIVNKSSSNDDSTEARPVARIINGDGKEIHPLEKINNAVEVNVETSDGFTIVEISGDDPRIIEEPIEIEEILSERTASQEEPSVDDTSDNEDSKTDEQIEEPLPEPLVNQEESSVGDTSDNEDSKTDEPSNNPNDYFNNPELYSQCSYDKNRRAQRFNNKKKHKGNNKKNKGFNDYKNMGDY